MALLAKQLNDFRLTTAEILYRLPDFPKLLQSYVWQDYDRAPEFPELRRFLDFWETNLDGKLYAVRVASLPVISEGRTTFAEIDLTLH